MLVRVLTIAALAAAVAVAAIVAITAPAAAVGGAAFGLLVGAAAALMARETATGDDVAAATAAGRRVGLVAGGATAVGCLLLIGLVAIAGPATGAVLLALLVAAPMIWIRRRLGRPADVVPSPLAGPAAVLPAADALPSLSIEDLCSAWLLSRHALLADRPVPDRQPAVRMRADLLDELERRDRDGFARWMGAGARPGSDPRSYLITGRETTARTRYGGAVMSRPARYGHDRRRPTSVLPPDKGEPAADPVGLLSAAGGGDLGAFAAFYDRTAPAVWGLLRCALDDSADAERTDQRVYEHLWRNAPSFDPFGGSAYSLLMSVARRELVGPIRDLIGRLRKPAPSGDAPMADG